MDDFPTNPEDGELWLPSYIIQEISTTTTTATTKSPQQNNVIFAPHLRRNNIPQDSKSNLVEICFGSFGTNNGAVPAVNNNNNNNNNVGPPAPVISFHKPVTLAPTTDIIQGFEGRKSMAVVGTGTGVFLPHLMNALAKKPEEISAGTGVFLNHQVAVTCQRKKTSDKEEEEALGMNNTKKCYSFIQQEVLGKPENYQHASGSGICLPKDWTY